MSESSAVQTINRAVALSDEMSVQEALTRFDKIEELAERALKQGLREGTGDYGIFPGTKQKVLFKSGAEKLCTVFRLGAFYSIEAAHREANSDHVTYTVRCSLRHQPTGSEVGSALGLCSSKETKYRYRSGSRKCPKCGSEAIIKGKAEYGGGWLCFGKRGGCGDKFKDGDASIEKQDTGKTENPDIADVENTILKMAEKRALVAATLNALGVSSLFTQDVVQDNSDEGEEEKTPETRKPVQTKPPPGGTPYPPPDKIVSMAAFKEVFNKACTNEAPQVCWDFWMLSRQDVQDVCASEGEWTHICKVVKDGMDFLGLPKEHASEGMKSWREAHKAK